MNVGWFARDTTSVARGDGVRDLTFSDRWVTPLGRVNGGFVLAALLRGLADELGRDDPLVASITYLSGAPLGPVEIHCRPLRIGRRVQTGQADLVVDGRTYATLVASFGARTAGQSYLRLEPPVLPPPEDCLDPLPPSMPRVGLLARVEFANPDKPGWALGEPSGDAYVEGWQRLEGGAPIDLIGLAFLTDTFVSTCYELGEFATTTVQLTVHLHHEPAPGWVATRMSTDHLDGGFHDENCQIWDTEGRLVAQARQLQILV
ncbi:MAG: thioesterase family protein [Aeromicrobium sp.]